MESFTKVDIFDTKGIEYLFVIGYLLFLIIFWNVATHHEKIVKKIKSMVNTISAGILRIPQGLYYNRSHTWAHLGETGIAKVGLDDFLQHITGEVTFTQLKKPGESIKKGDLMTQIDKAGRHLNVFSPISGQILKTNDALNKDPEMLNEDPLEKGWIYKIKPDDWVKETRSCYFADDATTWLTKELERFKDFLTGGPMRKYSSEPAMVMLQDGGEIRDNVLSDLPDEVWNDFQKEFLDQT
jgi:glycine cleavage system H protein